MTVRRWVALLAVVLLLGACGADGGEDSAAEGTSDGAGATVTSGRLEGDMSAADGEVAEAGDDAGVGAAADEDAPAEPGSPEVPLLPEPPAVRTGDRIIKEGTVSIEVEPGKFDAAYLAVVAAARNHGGDVVGSSTRTAENGDTFGSVTVRVPVANFEDLVVGMGDIGEIRNRDVDSQDVSAEYTDLESRLRHLQAQERFYLGLFDKADSVQDAISVQQQLEGIQAQIEKIQGRRNFLDDRTTFSTLTVELFEPEAGGELLLDDEPATDRPSLAHYWDTARDAFVNVVGALLVAVMFLLPLLVPLLVVLALWLNYRRPRREIPPPPMAQEDEDREPVGAGR